VDPPADHSSAAIELRGVVKRFGSVRVLEGVDLAVPAGATTVLIGPSGAGKTVTIKHILGLLEPSRGTVLVEGRDLSALSGEELNQVRRRMSVVLQGALPFTCGLFYSLNVYDNVAAPLRDRTGWPEARIRETTLENLALVGLRDRAGAMPADLSAGMAKRTAIARALALDSRIVIIDDFDSGIDGVRLALLRDLLREVQRESGATFLFSTHDMRAARDLADHAAVINAGRIIASGPADEVFASDDAAVHQLVTGELTGPIQLRDSG
jgi:phospholipid/cholesterol/gamma-HCH transport system ATP-binding protein